MVLAPRSTSGRNFRAHIRQSFRLPTKRRVPMKLRIRHSCHKTLVYRPSIDAGHEKTQGRFQPSGLAEALHQPPKAYRAPTAPPIACHARRADLGRTSWRWMFNLYESGAKRNALSDSIPICLPSNSTIGPGSIVWRFAGRTSEACACGRLKSMRIQKPLRFAG